MKKKVFICLFLLLRINGIAQLQNGSLEKTITLFSYTNQENPEINLNLNLQYNSGNGLKVDEMPGSIGSGWSLEGLPKIVRIQIGGQDDEIETPGNWNTIRRPCGYLFNPKPINSGCPGSLNYYPIFMNLGFQYSEDNSTTADRELDQFVLQIDGRSIPFVLNKNGVDCIVLDKSKVKIIRSSSGSIDVPVRNTILSFIVTDENGVRYEFGEAEAYRSFIYKGVLTNAGCISKSINTAVDDPIGPEYAINAWYVTKISRCTNCGVNTQITFQYEKQVYDYKYVKMLYGEASLSPLPVQPFDPCKFEYNTILPAPFNTNINVYFTTTKLKGREIRGYIERKEIKRIQFPNNEFIDFEYNLLRKDLPSANALTKIVVGNGTTVDYSYEFIQSYFVKNEIKMPSNTEEEKWSRLCLKTIHRKSGDNLLSEKPYVFDYYTGSNGSEDFVPPPFFHAQDPFGYYNGDFSGTPTDRKLQFDDNDIPNWAKVCFYNYATFTAGPEEIVFNPKLNYARNGLLKSVIIPTGGKEEFEYEQIFTKSVNENYNSAKYKSFITRIAPSGDLEYAYGGVSLAKKKIISAEGNILQTYTYDYIMQNGVSSFWGAEAGRVKSMYTIHYEAENKVFNPITGQCEYEYKYPGSLLSRPVETSPIRNNDIGKIYSAAKYAYGIYRNIQTFDNTPKKSQGQAFGNILLNYIIQYVIVAIIDCFLYPTPTSVTNMYVTSNSLLNTNNLPFQYSRVKVSEFGSNGVSNGCTVYEYTTPNDFPLIVPTQEAILSNKPRGFYWMYGLPKKISVFDKDNNILNETENNFLGNGNEILSTDNTKSCNCEPKKTFSMKHSSWIQPSTYSIYNSTSNSDMDVDFYNKAVGTPILLNSTQKIYKNNSTFVTSTSYEYSNSNNQVSKISAINSKGNLIETKNYYVDDYNLLNPNNYVLNQLKNNNVIAIPISTETWQTKSGYNPELLSLSTNEFEIGTCNELNLKKIYNLQSPMPISQNIIGVFDPNQLVRNTTYIKPIKQINYYGCVSIPKETIEFESNRVKSFLYRDSDRRPIATISNAYADECSYIPFENFTNNSTFFTKWPVSKPSKLTFLTDNVDAIKVAIVTWNGNTWIYNDISPTHTAKIDTEMTFFEFDIPTIYYQLQVRNVSSCQMREFRFYPKNAFMTTVDYDVAGRKISECDINNRITYYEYDGLGRLIKILDEKHNIIKTYEYHFKN